MRTYFNTLTGIVTLRVVADCSNVKECVEVKHTPAQLTSDNYCLSKHISITEADAFDQNAAEAFSAKADHILTGRAA